MLPNFQTQVCLILILTCQTISKASDLESTMMNLSAMVLKFHSCIFNVNLCVSLWRRLPTTLMRQDEPKLMMMSRRSQQSQQSNEEGPDANVVRAPISADPELANVTTMSPTLQVQYLLTVLVVARLILQRQACDDAGDLQSIV